MQDFLENVQPRTFAMMLIAIVLLVAALPVTYLLLPQLKLYRLYSEEQALLDQAIINSDSLSKQLANIDAEARSANPRAPRCNAQA